MCNDLLSLKESYIILKKVYKRAKLPIADFSFFKNLYEKQKYGLKLFCAKYDNKLIGSLIALVYKDTIYDLYAGANPKYYNKYPNDLVPWEIFLWGKRNGYNIFDFGGAGKPNVPYGVRNYKKKFGGFFVNYGRFEKINNFLLFNFAKFGFKIWQRIKY